MSEPNITEFYRKSFQRGDDFCYRELWTNAAVDTIPISPDTNKAIFVSSVQFLVSDNVDFGAVELKISPWKNSTDVDEFVVIDDLSDILQSGEDYSSMIISGSNYHICTYKFKVPIYLRSSTDPVEAFVIENIGGAITLNAGKIFITVRGWIIAEDDVGFEVEDE